MDGRSPEVHASLSNQSRGSPHDQPAPKVCRKDPFQAQSFSQFISKGAGSSQIRLYADDTILYLAPTQSAASTLHLSLTSFEESFHGLQLHLNNSKTKCIVFSRRSDLMSPLSRVNTFIPTKSLGIWLDSPLPFITHINIF